MKILHFSNITLTKALSTFLILLLTVLTFQILQQPARAATAAFVQGAQASSNGGANTIAATLGSATTAGNAFVVGISWDGDCGTQPSMSDNKGNTGWTTVVACKTDTRHNQSMMTFYLPNISNAGSSHSVTVNFNTNRSYRRFIVHEVSGLNPAGSLDKTAFVNNEAGVPITVGPATTTVAGEYVFAVVMNDSSPANATINPDTTVTNIFTERVTASAANNEMQSEDFTQSNAGAISATWRSSNTNHALAQMATFKPSGAASTPAPTPTPPPPTPAPTPLVTPTPTPVVTPTPTPLVTPSPSSTPSPTPSGTPVAGPLKASTINPNYFVDPNGKAVVLAGSHTWNTLQDWGTNGQVQDLDFNAFVNMLTSHNQNFTLLWQTELPHFCNLPTTQTNTPDFTVREFPWQRTGPGLASDGLPKFDLTKYDQTFFDRLRARTQQLNNAGIYTGVYFFTGEWVNSFRCTGDGFPLSNSNNINGVDDGAGSVGAYTMTAPNAITDIQDALVDKTIDTLNDLPNVVWIVSEEAPSASDWWNGHMIEHAKTYEASKPLQHPVGYAVEADNIDSNIYNSNADWVAPSTKISPTTSCGTGTPTCKVNINDSDHSYFGMWNDDAQDNRNFFWENFTRGNSVAFMDPYTVYYPRENRNLCPNPVNGICSAPDTRWENVRSTLGYIRSYADKMNLIAMTPQNSLSSTGFVLANTSPSSPEFLVYSPNSDTFSVNLSNINRSLKVEWFNPTIGVSSQAGTINGGSSAQVFTAPFSSADAVLYLVDNGPIATPSPTPTPPPPTPTPTPVVTPTPTPTPTPDTTKPTVSMTAPASNAQVSNIVNVTADAADNIGVIGVRFKLDGSDVGVEDTTAPYGLQWDTRTVANGAHVLTAVARDAAGNSQTSDPITVNVSNTDHFQNEILATGFNLPTTVHFLPDGRMLVTELPGKIKVLQPPYTQVDSQLFLDLNLQISGYAGLQQGIFDLVFDPDFANNHYYYIFYTNDSPNVDRLSRFTANSDFTSTIAGSELILYQDPETPNTEHHGGALNFGNDGKLYFTTGEHFDGNNAQNLNNPRGKIHRINKDGTIPTDNPFYDGAGPHWDSIWAYGLRNPFRAYYDAPSGKFYVADVGGNDYSVAKEEVNLGVAGANYGWPNNEGNCSGGCTSPLYFYPHSGRDASITGGFIYHGTQFPNNYQGAYFFADYAQNWIRGLTFNANGTVASTFNFEPTNGSLDGPYGDIVYLTEGPDGSLYYVDLGYSDIGGTFGTSKIRRIRYIQSNQAPVASAAADPTSGPTPLLVNFSSAGSMDPENQPLTYLWNFGDNTTSTEANPTHTYAQAGPYTVRLTVSDAVNSTLAPPITISAGSAPEATILTPTNGSTFRGADVISFSGDATDPDDGSLPASAYTWAIDFLHAGHVHPGALQTGVKSGTFTIPTSGHDFSGDTRYRVMLTVTDSNGLSSTKSVLIFPQKVNLTFATVPNDGLTLYLDGIAKTATFVYDTLIGFTHNIEARNQTQGNTVYNFTSWSDDGAQQHNITVPDIDQTYVATFSATINPVAFVQAAQAGSNAGSTTLAASFSGNTSVNNALIASVAWDGNCSPAPTISDSKSNTGWVTAVSCQTDVRHNQSMQTFYLPKINSAGASHSVTVNFGTGRAYRRLVVHEVTGLNPAGALDKTAFVNNDSGVPVNVGPVTTTAGNEYVFAVVMSDSNPATTTIGPDTGASAVFTERTTASAGDNELQSEDFIQGTAGAISGTWTLSGANDVIAQMATFKSTP